ncbi:MAG: hypothetical protein ABL949_13655 [Fimbriimonadaceae bacterium]
MNNLLWTSNIRAHISGDSIIDWLELYGRDNGFEPDTHRDAYLPQCDFLKFIRGKGQEFEDAIVERLRTIADVQTVTPSEEGSPTVDSVNETKQLLRAGTEIIRHAVLIDDELGVIGKPDLLVRSDVLNRIAANTYSESGAPTHHIAVDIKFTTIDLNAAGEIANNGSQEFYKAQLALYNYMLSRAQGYDPNVAFLLGRGWRTTKERSSNAFDKLGRVTFPQPQWKADSIDWTQKALDALDWLREVTSNGANWEVAPNPSSKELRPDMSHQNDAPWRKAKQEIARAQECLTLLWQVGGTKRDAAHLNGITRYTDPRVNGQTCGLKDEQARILEAILDVNLKTGPVVRPETITAGREDWGTRQGMEFYVDFETVSDLDDDMTSLPEKGGYPAIFMIGCGHEENGEWQFECFIAETLDETGERKVINDWMLHMDAVRTRLAPDCEQATLYHWSYAEVSVAQAAYNSALARLSDERLAQLKWYDLWKNVFRAQPVVVEGAWGFGLKAIAKNLRRHGLIETEWADGPTDGLGAMAGAWWCYRQALEQRVPVSELCLPESERKLMAEIRDYNEVDCKVMWQILDLLRR